MLLIRTQQVETLARATHARFAAAMVAHLQVFAPAHCRAIGSAQVARAVDAGLQRAANHGFDRHGPLQLYLETMWMFGSQFDSDPLLPWAGAALRARPTLDQMDRAQLLYEGVLAYLDQVCGREQAQARAALSAIVTLARAPNPPAPADATALLALLQEVYPSKCAYVGTPVLRALFARAQACAAAHGLTMASGRTLIALLQFVAGHGCTTDPLFPWIGRTLASRTAAAPPAATATRTAAPARDANEAAARERRLRRKAAAYLEAVLATPAPAGAADHV